MTYEGVWQDPANIDLFFGHAFSVDKNAEKSATAILHVRGFKYFVQYPVFVRICGFGWHHAIQDGIAPFFIADISRIDLQYEDLCFANW
jgi:hypothetical protein